jgi:predicted nucleic acid-binding protein
VFWDTNLFIYLLEDCGSLTARVTELRVRMLERGDVLITSAFTLGELLVKPIETGRKDLQEECEFALNAAADVVPFDRDSARHYARIRGDRSIKAPDAIQLACAATAGVDLFITNDDRLGAKVVPGVQFITSLDKSPI